jgi:CHAD domain-containing protein
MARARVVPELDCDAPFALAAANVVAARGAEMIEHSREVHDLGDIERLHDMRVATRRLRAALEVFEPAFPRKRLRATLREVKAIADALGERRDPDVAIEMIESFAREARPADRPGLEAILEPLREEQRHANEELRPFVTGERLATLKRDLEELVAVARARVAPDVAGEPRLEGDRVNPRDEVAR